MLNRTRTGGRHGARRGIRARQRGISMTELMIGVTIGLIVLSGTLALFSGHLRSNGDMLRTTRLNNELRGTLDLIVRDLRRASYWGTAVKGVWFPGTVAIESNPFSDIAVGTGQVTYRYDVDGDGAYDNDETFSIRRNGTDGTVELLQLDTGGGVTSTLPLSDGELTNITALTFVMNDRTTSFACLKAGAGPVAPTPPVLHVREITVTLTGQLRADPTVTRTLTEAVRVRNDMTEGSCPS
jgi:Tfp pilus assembly protein PilW